MACKQLGDLYLNQRNMAKLQECLCYVFRSSPVWLYPLTLNYLVKKTQTVATRKDYALDSEAATLLKKFRPYVSQFHSSPIHSARLQLADICGGHWLRQGRLSSKH